jgi:hypothetical protein
MLMVIVGVLRGAGVGCAVSSTLVSGGTHRLRACSALPSREGGQHFWVQSKSYSLVSHSVVERWFGMGNDEGQHLMMG